MNKEVVKKIIIFAVGLALGIVLMKLFAPKVKEKVKTTTMTVVKRDSVTRFDTVRIIKPVAKDSIISRFETVYLPIKQDNKQTADTLIDTLLYTQYVHDTVAVEIPIEQKVYADSTYTAYVSGFRPQLDSIEVYPRTDIVHEYINTTTETVKTVTKRNRFGVGLVGGYGYDGKRFRPFIGVGVSYNIFGF